MISPAYQQLLVASAQETDIYIMFWAAYDVLWSMVIDDVMFSLYVYFAFAQIMASSCCFVYVALLAFAAWIFDANITHNCYLFNN